MFHDEMSDPKNYLGINLFFVFQIDCVSDDELVARVNMADAKFSFQEKGKMYHPAWIAPEVIHIDFHVIL